MRRERPDQGDDALEPEARAPGLTIVRPRTRDGPLVGALAVLAAALLIAIAKPWAGAAPAPPAAPRVSTAAPPSAAAATDDRSAEGLAAPICLGAGGWRVASLEAWRSNDVRVWRAIEPAPSADGPFDPGIPSVPIVAVAVTALGWCAPAFGPAEPVGPVEVTAWRIGADRATEVVLQQVQPELGSTPLGALYVTVASAAPYPPSDRGHAPWPAGRVVFRWRDTSTSVTAWFAADVTLTPPATDAPAAGDATARPAG